MQALLALSRLIDGLNAAVGGAVKWLILVAVLLSAGNASVRYALNASSNAWLEAQWYLFSAVFLLSAGYALLRDEHIRIDILSGRLSPRGRAWVDVLGSALFLLPGTVLVMVLSWPVFLDSFTRHETSSDAGGLLRWPAKLLIPVAFGLLAAQGVSELIKRIAFLAGRGPDPGRRPAAPLPTPPLQQGDARDPAA